MSKETDAAEAVKEISPATLEEMRGGKAHERAAAIIYDKCVKGREPGTGLRTQKELERITGFSTATLTAAKAELGNKYHVLKKEKGSRYWVVA